MKKEKKIILSLSSIALFNLIFMILLVFYNNIIIIPNKFFKNTSKEYWYWYLDNPAMDNEGIIIGVTFIIKIIFSLIFLFQIYHLISKNKYRNLIKKKSLLISLFLGLGAYILSFLFIKYRVEHYRLFMTLISTEILSLILLNLVLKLKRSTVRG